MPRPDLNTFFVFDFRRGLDLKTSPLVLALQKGQNSLVKASNVVFTSSGAASKRLDTATATTASVGAGVAITGGIQFVKSNGTRVVVFGTDAGTLYKLNADGSTTSIGTGFTAGTRWYFAVYNDKLIIANRVDLPRKWDGTTLAVLGGSPPATGGQVVVHGNRVFFLEGANPSKLTWSALNNEEDYTAATNAGSLDVSLNDGSNAVALVPSINELVILKGRRPNRLQGTSPSTFALTNLVPTTGSVGAISSQGALFAQNEVWYLASNGFVRLTAVQEFGDLRESFVSDRLEPYFTPGTPFTLALAALPTSVAAYDSQFNRIYLAVDAGGDGKNDTVLVYDLTTKAWSTWAGVAIASLWPVMNATTGVVEMYAGGYDGHIRKLNQDVATTAIDGEVRHLSCLNAPGIEKSVRHLFLYLKEQGNYAVTVGTSFDFGAAGGQTYTASLLGGSKTLGVNWVLGVDPLGAKAQIVKRVDTHGTGEFMEVSVRNRNAGEPFTWYGYECLWRARRLVRRGSAAVA